MIIGGLSEKEVESLTRLLQSESISHEIITDDSMLEANQESMQYNLRHLNSPSISTHVLAIRLADGALDNISENVKKSLLQYGVTHQVPEEFMDMDQAPENIQREINKGNQRIVGYNFLHQILLGLGAFFIYLLFKFLIN